MHLSSSTQKEFKGHGDRALRASTHLQATFAKMGWKKFLALSMLGMLGMMTEAFAQAPTAEERLIQAPPKGFKMVSRDINKTSTTIYMIPEDEAPALWTKRLSTQIIYNPKSTSYFTLRGEQQRYWATLCDASSVDYAKDSAQNGYATHLWLQACRFRLTKNKPMFALSKMIDGDRHAYVVQVVFHYTPDDAELSKWVTYLDNVQLCGGRQAAQACQPVATTR